MSLGVLQLLVWFLSQLLGVREIAFSWAIVLLSQFESSQEEMKPSLEYFVHKLFETWLSYQVGFPPRRNCQYNHCFFMMLKGVWYVNTFHLVCNIQWLLICITHLFQGDLRRETWENRNKFYNDSEWLRDRLIGNFSGERQKVFWKCWSCDSRVSRIRSINI